jgi:hypothetical protein
MKTLLSTLFVIATANFAIAADKPDFSGTWKMDPEKSVFGAVPPTTSMTLTVDHRDPNISVHQVSTGPEGDRDLTYKYSTDGKETVSDYMGTAVKNKARWDGKAVVVNGSLDAGGTEVKLTSKWTLSDDGKTFTDVVGISTPQGDLEITFVLVKQ